MHRKWSKGLHPIGDMEISEEGVGIQTVVKEDVNLQVMLE